MDLECPGGYTGPNFYLECWNGVVSYHGGPCTLESTNCNCLSCVILIYIILYVFFLANCLESTINVAGTDMTITAADHGVVKKVSCPTGFTGNFTVACDNGDFSITTQNCAPEGKLYTQLSETTLQYNSI